MNRAGKTITMDEIRAELARQVAAAGGPSRFARIKGVHLSLVSMALNGARPPGPNVLDAIGVGVRREFYWKD